MPLDLTVQQAIIALAIQIPITEARVVTTAPKSVIVAYALALPSWLLTYAFSRIGMEQSLNTQRQDKTIYNPIGLAVIYAALLLLSILTLYIAFWNPVMSIERPRYLATHSSAVFAGALILAITVALSVGLERKGTNNS
ncbi:MAG: hypothetical protein JNK21_03965 [Rhodospirillaceae bacterium]|nr:hypothetical protein [Rhodospirillaceae bacterium]